jgi:preprotein translocase subunit SecF
MSMEMFRDTRIDWLRQKWFFLGISFIFSVAGLFSILFWHHVPVGIDFRGGTQVMVKFDSQPNDDLIRWALARNGVKGAQVQRISEPMNTAEDEVVISLPKSALEMTEEQGRIAIKKGLIANYHESGFDVLKVDVVGPTAGKQLQTQAWLATAYSLLGMLVYLWFRFELIYGVAAVVAVFHDTLITVGAFSLANREIDLTVVAAILTLIGYSMNDTIVVFDRIRENLAIDRRHSLAEVVNRSINQTLSRTVLTSGLTLLTVLSLYLFGGASLNGFSFALVVGILIGTYSSIAVAAPMLVAYQNWRTPKGRVATLPVGR